MESDKARVKLGCGFTISLDNFEFARLDVGIEVEGRRDNLPELWKQAEEEVHERLQTQIMALKDEVNNEKETLLGKPAKPKFK